MMVFFHLFLATMGCGDDPLFVEKDGFGGRRMAASCGFCDGFFNTKRRGHIHTHAYAHT